MVQILFMFLCQIYHFIRSSLGRLTFYVCMDADNFVDSVGMDMCTDNSEQVVRT